MLVLAPQSLDYQDEDDQFALPAAARLTAFHSTPLQRGMVRYSISNDAMPTRMDVPECEE